MINENTEKGDYEFEWAQEGIPVRDCLEERNKIGKWHNYIKSLKFKRNYFKSEKNI